MATSLNLKAGINKPTDQHPTALSALTLSVEHHKQHLACKNMD